MEILPIILGIAAGVCIGTGIIYLFIGFRRRDGERLHLTFALFALAYAGANITAILEYKATSLEHFMQIGNLTALFTVTTLIILLWFVAAYTHVEPRIFLVVLTATISLVGMIAIIRPNSIHTEIFGIVPVTLPWGEVINLLDSSESIWEIIFFLSEIVLVGFAIYATIRQYLSGERHKALALALGLAFLLFALIFDIIFIDSGRLNFIFLGDYGFLPLAIIMGLQLANQVLRTEDELAEYRQNLETLIDERTTELEQTNLDLTQEIVQRQEVEAELHQSERRARALLDAPPDSALLIDLKGIILDINETAADRLGITTMEARGSNIFSFFPPLVAEVRKQKISELMATGNPVHWGDSRDGRYFENHLYPIMDDQNNVVNIAVYTQDVTELEKARKRERELATAEERNRLARDLHDAVTQTIYSSSLIAEVLPKIWERSPEEGKRNLIKLRQLVRGALAEMRTLLFELRPTSLEAADLVILLRQLGDGLTGRTRIPVKVNLKAGQKPQPNVKIALYRIAQEALNNIAKHSEATQAWVDLQSRDDQVILQIIDNGIGFNPDPSRSSGKMGLQIMQERAEKVGASLEVESSPGKGTRILVIWTADIKEVSFE